MEQNEAERNHQLYINASPEYQNTVARVGRNLTPDRVRMILAAHSFTEDDLLGDDLDNITGGATSLPETLDAAMLYAWLGY